MGGETRVSASPESVKKLKALGFDVVVEAGAGSRSRIPDQSYVDAGATIGRRRMRPVPTSSSRFAVRLRRR